VSPRRIGAVMWLYSALMAYVAYYDSVTDGNVTKVRRSPLWCMRA
jgi:hypothetical protein